MTNGLWLSFIIKELILSFFQPHKYAVTLSYVGQLPVEAVDSVITVKDTDFEFRSETEVKPFIHTNVARK